MELNPKNLPAALVSLMPMAEKWGIADDCEREELLQNASKDELDLLVHSIDEISDENLYGWLGGPEAKNQSPTQEYLAMTCLTMAIDSAKVKLKRLAKQ